MKRKKCRREVKRTMNAVGWRPPPSDFLSQEDVTRRFLTAKCLSCLRCPRLARRLAALAIRPPDTVRPPLRNSGA